MTIRSLSCSIIALGCALVSTHLVAADANAPVDAGKFKAPIKVAAVGDSITAGHGTKNRAIEGYPAQLGRMLGNKWEVRNFGVSGATLLNNGDKPYQKLPALKQAFTYDPDVVVIMLGTNDTKPQNWEHKSEFVADYKDLISQFKKLSSHPRIFIAYAPYVSGKGNFGINEAGVTEQIPMIEQIAKSEDVGIIDIHGALNGKDNLLKDRVHPNVEGATVMAKTFYKALTGKEFAGAVPAPAEPAASPAPAAK